MKKLTILVLAVVLAGSAAGASFAQGPGAMRAACGADMAKLCPNAQTRDDRRQCMMSKRDQLSDACKSAIAAAMAARNAAGPSSAAPHN
ncbi:MAG TPA: hypothetical protein VII42_06885 [Caulobacteraceae bacterium]